MFPEQAFHALNIQIVIGQLCARLFSMNASRNKKRVAACCMSTCKAQDIILQSCSGYKELQATRHRDLSLPCSLFSSAVQASWHAPTQTCAVTGLTCNVMLEGVSNGKNLFGVLHPQHLHGNLIDRRCRLPQQHYLRKNCKAQLQIMSPYGQYLLSASSHTA